MLSSVAMDKEWVVSDIKNYFECFTNCIFWNVGKRFLVPVDPELEKPDSVGPKEIEVGVRVWLRAKTQDGAEVERAQEAEVGGVWEARAEHVIVHHREVERRHQHRRPRGGRRRRKRVSGFRLRHHLLLPHRHSERLLDHRQENIP